MAFAAHGLKGDKDILISQISSIQFKTAGWIGTGYIQFAFIGGQEAKGELFQGIYDENTVTFDKKQQYSFEKIKAEIERRMGAEVPATRISNLDELEKLDSLRRKGIITEDEFNAKKKQLLGI